MSFNVKYSSFEDSFKSCSQRIGEAAANNALSHQIICCWKLIFTSANGRSWEKYSWALILIVGLKYFDGILCMFIDRERFRFAFACFLLSEFVPVVRCITVTNRKTEKMIERSFRGCFIWKIRYVNIGAKEEQINNQYCCYYHRIFSPANRMFILSSYKAKERPGNVI